MSKIDFSKWINSDNSNENIKKITAVVEYVQPDNSRAVVRTTDGLSVKLLNKTGELLSVGDTVQVLYRKLLTSKTAYIEVRNGEPVVTGSNVKGVGENTEGKTFEYIESIYEGDKTSEIFNDYINNTAAGGYAHAEGDRTTAIGVAAHTEGTESMAIGGGSHAEGIGTFAGDGGGSHAEGYYTHAEGKGSHSEGQYTVAEYGAHAEGDHTYAHGTGSHAGGYYTKAVRENQFVIGKYNVEDYSNKFAFILGNGTNENNRSNAFAIDWNGNLYIGNSDVPINLIDLISRLETLEGKA